VLAVGQPTRLCPWCEAPLADGGIRRAGRIRCDACGTATIDPWPSELELDDAYGAWYRPASGRRFGALGDALLRRTRGSLAARVDAIAPPGPVLDVGAGDGALLDALAARGRPATGLERVGGRADIRDEPLEAVDGEWAAVVFWHSLEHLPQPGAAIAHAARLLAPGGVVVVAVPDYASLQARAFGDRWLHLDPPRHLVHLTTAALTAGLERRGLRVQRVSRVRAGQVVIGWLHGLVGWLPGLDLYRALRRPEARSAPLTRARWAASLAAGIVLLPVAALAAAAEVALGRSGTVYVEARRA
jgi:2-polyprenyl-3-methyl-5-hydroxy-6-metoxy-1,4-benzoquinol methylase